MGRPIRIVSLFFGFGIIMTTGDTSSPPYRCSALCIVGYRAIKWIWPFCPGFESMDRLSMVNSAPRPWCL